MKYLIRRAILYLYRTMKYLCRELYRLSELKEATRIQRWWLDQQLLTRDFSSDAANRLADSYTKQLNDARIFYYVKTTNLYLSTVFTLS